MKMTWNRIIHVEIQLKPIDFALFFEKILSSSGWDYLKVTFMRSHNYIYTQIFLLSFFKIFN